MNLSKQSSLYLENFIRVLKKKEKEIDHHNNDATLHYNAMVNIKDYIGETKDNENLPINERTKIIIDKLKELEILGSKYDKSVKCIKDIRSQIEKDLNILIDNIHSSNNSYTLEQIRHYILQYIETKR